MFLFFSSPRKCDLTSTNGLQSIFSTTAWIFCINEDSQTASIKLI